MEIMLGQNILFYERKIKKIPSTKPWQDLNLHKPDTKSGALSFRRHGLTVEHFFGWISTDVLLFENLLERLYPNSSARQTHTRKTQL